MNFIHPGKIMRDPTIVMLKYVLAMKEGEGEEFCFYFLPMIC